MEFDSIRKGWLNGSFNLSEIQCWNLTFFLEYYHLNGLKVG